MVVRTTQLKANDEEEVGDKDEASSRFGGGLGMSASEAAMALEEREMPPCLPGLHQYETMVVLRPDMYEEERLALIQRYEETLDCKIVAGSLGSWLIAARRPAVLTCEKEVHILLPTTKFTIACKKCTLSSLLGIQHFWSWSSTQVWSWSRKSTR